MGRLVGTVDEGSGVGMMVGWLLVGSRLDAAVGVIVDVTDGEADGITDGAPCGAKVCSAVGVKLGNTDGNTLGRGVDFCDGVVVGGTTGGAG